MCRTTCVMALVALCAGLAHSFSWEIVRGIDNRLEFMDIHGAILHTENVTSDTISETTYDPVHNKVLFADTYSIFSFDITTKKTECLMRTANVTVTALAYDPATESLFWVENIREMYTITLKPECNKNNVNEKHLIWSEDSYPNFIFQLAVDSCGGFIYWRSVSKINKVRFNGSEDEVVIYIGPDHTDGFVIDQQAQKIYFSDWKRSIRSADFNGENIRTIIVPTQYGYTLTVSKDFMYWVSFEDNDKYTTKQFPKNIPLGKDVEPKHFSDSGPFSSMAAYFSVNDIIPEEIPNCDNLKSLLRNKSVSTDVSLLCVHGTKVDGESRCECAQGYIGERCDVSVCYNYCLYGDCSTSADGQPKCSCYAGYSGDRCEVNSCQEYCLNGGLCFLSEGGKPLCRCTGHYEGKRCDVPLFQTKCSQAISLLKDMFITV